MISEYAPPKELSIAAYRVIRVQKRLIIGVSGASGAIYGIRLLEMLRRRKDVESHLIISNPARLVIKEETDYSESEVEKLANITYEVDNLAAAISSGSYRTEGMIVAPCSVKTLSAVANCNATNLLTRACDVTLKQRRKLVLLFRETPLHFGHIELMKKATLSGGIIYPPVPAFYTKPDNTDDIVDATLYRVLDLFGFHLKNAKRWTGKKE